VKSKTPTIHRADEALSTPPPIDWIVNPLFSRPSVNIVVGEGGSKKTYCILDLMICIATGKDWLGMKVKKMPCLFVDEESGNERMLRRLHQLLNGHKITKTIPFYFLTLEQFNLRDAKQIDELKKIIDKTKAGFVSIDALADVIMGADENSVKDIMPVFNHSRTLSSDTGAAVTYIHHTNKQGGYRGSSSIQGAVDLMLGVDGKRKSSVVKFESIKERDIDHVEFSASVEFVSPNEVTIKHAEYTKNLSKIQQFVIGYYKKHGACEVSELLSKKNGHSSDAIRRAIYDIAALNIIRRTNPGARGKPAVYDLVNGNEK
jgi:predicted ATP-dependent serine protease